MSTDKEALEIPRQVRLEVLDRDGRACRMCGQTSSLVLHHLLYGGDLVGMGGRRSHDPEGIVTLGGAYEHQCHQHVHSQKSLWQPILLAVVHLPGVTGYGLRRWLETGTSPFSLDLPAELQQRLSELPRERRRGPLRLR